MEGYATGVSQTEAVRLVIWDLDETFWGGTLTEGGIAWREENAEIVRTLAQRGIVSAICSKNDPATVQAVLDQHGMGDFFVFSSISWEPKGPRLAALVAAVQLRAPSILFIDDNPMNRAEAKLFVPGLQVQDETIVPTLLSHELLQGKADPEMSRLAHYRLLALRREQQARSSGDTTDFLRESGITVSIDYDLAPHLDRAVELINRTNQLNFTKSRLPEDPVAAREALQTLLARHIVQAGILRVRDRYGDYGYCGLYVLLNGQAQKGPTLAHFAFSCRVLGMGIETWLYQQLKRPILHVKGEVLTDVINDTRTIDWIRMELPGIARDAGSTDKKLAYVLARGGCDMQALVHYFDAVSNRIIEEVAGMRDGKSRLKSSSVIAVHAMEGVAPALVRDSKVLGFLEEDFETVIADPPPGSPAVWLLNFTLEQPVPYLKHRETGGFVPAWIQGMRGPPMALLKSDPSETGLDPEMIRELRKNFVMAGLLPDEMFQRNLQMILRQAPEGVRVFILLANELAPRPGGETIVLEPMRHRNALVTAGAALFPNVEVLKPLDFMTTTEFAALDTPHHYNRVVYYRLFQHVMSRVGSESRG